MQTNGITVSGQHTFLTPKSYDCCSLPSFILLSPSSFNGNSQYQPLKRKAISCLDLKNTHLLEFLWKLPPIQQISPPKLAVVHGFDLKTSQVFYPLICVANHLKLYLSSFSLFYFCVFSRTLYFIFHTFSSYLRFIIHKSLSIIFLESKSITHSPMEEGCNFTQIKST